MNLSSLRLNKLLSEVIIILTSREKLVQLFRIHLYSNAIYLMIATAVTSLLGFVFWIIVARFYAPEDVGLASATIAATGLVMSLSRLGLEMGLVRFLHQSGEDASSMINTVFTIGILTSCTAALIFVAGLGFWSPALLFIRENPIYLVAFVVFVVASTVSTFTDHAFIAERRAGFALARSFIFSLLKLPLSILLAVFFHSFGIFASWGISLVIALLISIFLLLPRAQPGYRPFFVIRRGVVNDMIRFSFANYLSGFFWGSPSVVFPIMVVNLLGAEPNAYFYIAWAVGGVLTMIPTAVSTSLFVEGSYDEEKLGLNIRRSLKMVPIILVPAVILILVMADKLLLFFGSSYSQNAASLLRILALSTLPLAINIIYLGIKRVQKKLKLVVGLTAFIAVVTIGLAYLLLPLMGINGAGIAWLTSQVVVALVIIANLFRKRYCHEVEVPPIKYRPLA